MSVDVLRDINVSQLAKAIMGVTSTPRVDAAVFSVPFPENEIEPWTDCVTAEFARELELDLNKWNQEMAQKVIKLIEENERLRAKNTRQRIELRRLNNRLRAMWDGVRFAAGRGSIKQIIPKKVKEEETIH